MVGKGWDKLKKSKEDDYFERKNREALERLAKKAESPARPSPITGEPMEQINLNGVIIDRCPTSGGIWLDAGELEQLIEASHKHSKDSDSWLESFLEGLEKRSK